MTKSIRLLLISCIMLLFASLSLKAQVTVGSNLPPAKGALLDLKEFSPKEDNTTSTRGLGIPRVFLVSNSSLLPTIAANLNDDTTIKDSHVGLVVYNVGDEILESLETRLCKGLHVWDGSKWSPIVPYPTHTFGQDVIRCVEGPSYTIDCSSIKVHGLYKKNVSLDNTHYITVDVNFPSDYVGKEYILQALPLESEGVEFYAKDVITSTQQTITLKSKGKFSTVGSQKMVLVSNSSNKQVRRCTFELDVVLPAMRIVGVGSPHYQPASKSSGSRSYVFMSNPKAFGVGDEAKIKAESFIFENYHYRTTAEWIALLESKPDIVIRAYDNIMYDAVGAAIKAYVEAGGVFIDFNDNNNVSNAAVKALYGTTATSNTNSSNPGELISILNVDDEIVKGPWGDLAGKSWREDASYSQGVTNVPLNDIIVYSVSNSNSKPLIFRDKTRKYFYIGDGGFLSGAAAASSCCYPFRLDSNNLPTTGYQNDGYNAHFFANVITWALRQAATNGINEY